MRTILIAATAIATTHASAQMPSSTSSFCERLAPQLGMKAKTGPAKNSEIFWEVDALSGLKTFFLGGSTMVSFGVTPLGEPSIADYQRLQNTCSPNGKQIICLVREPLRLTVQAKGGVANVESTPGEKATVSTRGSRITCRNS